MQPLMGCSSIAGSRLACMGPQPPSQRLMDRVLRPHQKYAAAYLDDIVIHGEEWGAHLAQLEAVFQALQEAGLTANPKKCRLGLRDANYLGFTIGRGCVKPQVGKVEAIYEWPRPQTKRQVRVFLGLASYYPSLCPPLLLPCRPPHRTHPKPAAGPGEVDDGSGEGISGPKRCPLLRPGAGDAGLLPPHGAPNRCFRDRGGGRPSPTKRR